MVGDHDDEEAAISGSQASWAYTEEFAGEDEVLTRARARGSEVGAPPLSPGAGSVLRFLAASINARHVVEVGTGCGVSGVWLLRGMTDDGVLTTVDSEAEHHRLARETFTEAGYPAQRTRTITGRAGDVLPRLADSAYDLVFIDADKQGYPDYLGEALRLLRPGGVLAFDNVLWGDKVADPSQRDPDTVALRELGKSVRDHEGLVTALLPSGDGLLVAVKQETPTP